MNDRGDKNNNSAALMQIGEVSRLSGVGIQAIRFYEEFGLLDPAGRTQGGYRLYSDSALERIEFIRKSQALGFSLEEIREIIEHKRRGQRPCTQVRDLVQKKLDDMDERIFNMMRYRDELLVTMSEWDRAGEAEGHICGLIESSHIDHPPAGGKRKRKNGE